MYTNDPNQHFIHIDDEESDDERRNPRLRRQENSYEVHSRRDTSRRPEAQLAESFRGNFLTSRIQRKNSSALFRIVQGPKESLKSYYARFNAEKLLIDHLDSGVTFAAMARGVRPGTPLRFSLNKRPPENMTDLLDRVEKYLRAEEDSAHPQEEPSSNQKRRDRTDSRNPDSESKRPRVTMPRPFTPLTASREHILNQVKGQNILKWPKPMRMPADKRDDKLYCHFHKDHGHTTEECKVLQREIESLINKGHLRQFVKTNNRQGHRGNQRRPEEAQPKDPSVINTISGGPSAGGLTNSSRKAYAWQVNLTQGLTKWPRASTSFEFNDSDLEGVICPHDDAFGITLQVDAYSVKRILVDTGSSANIIFEEAFSQMGISKERVKPISSPLYGFTGASAPVEGIILLTIIAGTAPLQSVQTIDFLVVKVRSAERCLPFFNALKNIKNFEWTAECQASFEALKEYLASPPLLSKPIAGEMLFLYLAVIDFAVSAVLVREQDSKQFPIYYVSKVLQGAELRYPTTEKLAFALLIAARKLRPYFQSHTITVLTDKPLRRILHKPDLSGGLVPWSVELGEFDIQYKPRPSIKGQALADFTVECTLPIDEVESHVAQPEVFAWTLYIDGSSNTMGSGAVAHPQTNGQTEVTNRTLLQGLKKKLDGAKGLWVEELPKILWAYHTTTRTATGETPFSLAFGTEAIIPLEIGLPSARLVTYNPDTNDAGLRGNLDLLDETRDQVAMRLAAYQHRVAKFFDKRVRSHTFRIGDLVLRRMDVSIPRDAIGKLSPNWEGPYSVIKLGGPGSYQLETLDGKAIPRTWNARILRQYYS
ncbi:hypothetical protein RJ639_012054 [Escallonia herrerae]|uniref:Reverse transcriptase/retrotransposon-derived protein RNase H-like domain-containing protein n=1 Tax=Escallonia herrerae TaxID=1293975 RepID=A0AA89ARJ2_9ASTE|nr:hypothetical protein RJ639_012054 [Escallonia herrerae]